MGVDEWFLMFVSCAGAVTGVGYAILFDDPRVDDFQRAKRGCITILLAWLIFYGMAFMTIRLP